MQEEKLRKKKTDYRHKKKEGKLRSGFHEQEAEERSLRKNLAVQAGEKVGKEKQPIPVNDTEPVEAKGREENSSDLISFR